MGKIFGSMGYFMAANLLVLAVITRHVSASSNATSGIPEPKKTVDNTTSEERSRAITILFYSKHVKDGSFNEQQYKAMRQAIVDALNRRRPPPTTTGQDTTTTQEFDATTASDGNTAQPAASTAAETPAITSGEIKETTNPTLKETTAITTTLGPIIDARRKRAAEYTYTVDDITFVIIEPPDKDGHFRVAVFGTKANGEIIPQDVLEEAIIDTYKNTNELQKAAETGPEGVYKHIKGLPDDVTPVAAAAASINYRFWIPVLIALLILLILILLVCVCYSEVYNSKRKKAKQRTSNQKPLDDDDDDDDEPILRPTQVPQNFSGLPNGDPSKPQLDDSWGCIIPYDDALDNEENTTF